MMKRALYIGSGERGSTTLMRYDAIRTSLVNTHVIFFINSNKAFDKHSKIVTSIGCRFKVGPLIKTISTEIKNGLAHDKYDFIWIDKAALIDAKIIKELRRLTKCLIHFTPDPAFYYHRSKHFTASVPLFDYCITTKSYELDEYRKYNAKSVIYCTQGFDSTIHYPRHSSEEKEGIAFIGRFETSRKKILKALLKEDITVKLAGSNWQRFAKQNRHNKKLIYLGTGVYGKDYAQILSSSQIGLGLISKWIPEKHTTRTFEIPACGTAILTERNDETTMYFNDTEALFFENETEVVSKVMKSLYDQQKLNEITTSGYKRVTEGGFDYRSIIERIINAIGI